jgi:hypothetical protein
MNSFVHGGIHPLRRSADGFPVHLALQVLRNSNGLSTVTGMTMAVLTGDESVARPMSKIQPDFADCLPDLCVFRSLLDTHFGFSWTAGTAGDGHPVRHSWTRTMCCQ